MKLLLLLLAAGPLAAQAPAPRTLAHDGESRLYLLDAPKPRKGKKWPVVIALHGGGGNAEGMRRKTRLTKLGAGRTFIAVHPEGVAKKTLGKKLCTWNAGSCCGLARKENVDDVGFLSALIDLLVKKHGADPGRVYVTGHSNGGMMAYRLACEIPGKIAAIAPVGAPVREDTCVAESRMPILIIHGDQDDCGNFAGGEDCGGCFQRFLGLPVRGDNSGPCDPVPDHVVRWRRAQGCSGKVKNTRRGPLRRTAYRGCKAPVVLDVIRGHGHGWPGVKQNESVAPCRKRPKGFLCRRWLKVMGAYVDGYSASAAAWKFFKGKRR